MSTALQQKIVELIEVADVSVRIASQLRLVSSGYSISDLCSVDRAVDFLTAAIEGSQFVITGEVHGVNPSLMPLNWVADVRFKTSACPGETSDDALDEYEELGKFLIEIRDTLLKVRSGTRVDVADLQPAINFFSTLGKELGNRADQSMRDRGLFNADFTNCVSRFSAARKINTLTRRSATLS